MDRPAPSQTLCWLSRLAAAALATAQVLGAQSDDWPRYGYDAGLTGRSPLHGKIAKPQTLWSYSTAGTELQLEIVPAEGEHRARFEPNASVSPDSQRRMALPGPAALDVDGSGTLRPAPESYHERWARILPNVKGWQRVAWNQTWTDQKVCRLQLFAYDQGFDKPRLVWQSDPPEDTIFQPLNILYDLDGDGIPEVCVAAHYRVMIFNGTTGRKETELRYHHSRPYGWFGLADVDGDGRTELITIGDFQSHIDVLDFDPKKPATERLSVRWRRDIEQNIEERSKWPQVGPHPLADVNGDGRPEIVLNLFNDSGDSQWHAVVLNASNGQMLADFPRRFVQGTADLNADGKARLFLVETDGVLVPAYGMIGLVGWKDGGPAVEWSQPNAAWVCADLPRMGPIWSTTAAQGMRHVLLAGGGKGRHPAFLVAQRDPGAEPPFPTTLTAMRLSSRGVPETLWKVSQLIGDWQAMAFSNIGETDGLGVLLRLRLPSDTVLAPVCEGAEARLVERSPLGVTVSTPIAARLRPNGPMAVVVEGAAQTIVALQPPERGRSSPQVLWRRPGRGMGDGGRWLGPVAADLQGDGGKEIVVASQDASGRALLVAYRHDGSLLWQTRFDQVPGALPVWNTGALTFWWPGSFRGLGQTDLFVNTRRGLMHSDVGQLVDGGSGAILWRQEKAVIAGQFNWGYAGIPPAIADLDGEGRDELISLYPVCFWVADGRTGRLKRGVELAGRILWQWQGPATLSMPAVADLDGDGLAEIVVQAADGSIHCLGPAP